MISISEFRSDLLDKLFASGEKPVYTFVDKDDFSYIDLAVNGEDGEAAAFRIIITKLPPIFDEEGTAADNIARYIKELN